jgi:hypothetical protein
MSTVYKVKVTKVVPTAKEKITDKETLKAQVTKAIKEISKGIFLF